MVLLLKDKEKSLGGYFGDKSSKELMKDLREKKDREINILFSA